MPKFADDTTLEQFHVGTFGFTAQTIDELESSGYTLADIVVDVSGSTSGFTDAMEAALKGSLVSLKGDPTNKIKPHPKADSMMVRITRFDSSIVEIIGYTLLANIDIDSLTGALQARGATALFDACISGAEAAFHYADALRKEDYDVNGILIVITDGMNNSGKYSAYCSSGQYFPDKATFDKQTGIVATALKMPLKKEAMESYISILIGVNVGSCQAELDQFHQLAGFTQPLIALDDASPQTIGKIGGFISASVSSQSQARGTGGPSQSIANTI